MTNAEVMEKAEAIGFHVWHSSAGPIRTYVAYKRLSPNSSYLTIFASCMDCSDCYATRNEKRSLYWSKRRYSANRKSWRFGGLPQEFSIEA